MNWPVQHGHAAQVLREKDWSSHPLGPVEFWPPHLKGIVDAILACSFPLIVLWGPDLYQIYNDAYAEIMGPRHPEGMGQKTSECWPEVWSFNRLVYERVFQGETVDYQNQLLHLYKNGALEEYYFDLCYSPLRSVAGTIDGVLVTVFDVTNRYHGQAALKEKAKQLAEVAAIVESSEDAILSKDLNGIITSWNAAAAKLFGYEPEEIIGRSILTLIPEEMYSDEARIISRILAGRKIEHFETLRKKKSGELINVSLTISPVKNAEGVVIGASKILRDISDRKRMEQSLLQAEKIAATGRMAATIAHEVNNPLEAITNLLFLAKSRSTDAEVIGYLDTAENELSRVSHIAKQTLGYYREYASATKFSIAEVVAAAMEVYKPRCATAGITVISHVDSNRKAVMRRGEMMQVISNLLANSIYAMPSGGTLHIDVRDTVQPEGVEVTVSDTGTGIPGTVLPRVFDAFFTTRATIGTGIGLFIAKQFIEGHGGTIAIESDTSQQNHGTNIRIFLPAVTSYDDNAKSSQHDRLALQTN